MPSLNDIVSRIENQYKSYEKERHSEDEGRFIDVSLACDLADSIPYLIETIQKQQQEIESLKSK